MHAMAAAADDVDLTTVGLTGGLAGAAVPVAAVSVGVHELLCNQQLAERGNIAGEFFCLHLVRRELSAI